MAVNALKTCGPSCDGAGEIKALDALNNVSIEGNLAFGPLTLSADRHAGLTAVQIFGWDGTKDVATGDPTKISG